METSLQSTNINPDELLETMAVDHEEEHAEGEEGHVHLPGPSGWPLVISVGLLITAVGFLMINTTPVLVYIGIPLSFIAMLGLGLEDPMATSEKETQGSHFSKSYQEAAETGKPTALAESVLEDAEGVVDKTVTFSDTTYSAHPVKVFIEREGVVLSLYGKVELEEQKKAVEDALRQVPGVLDVMNFLVAEDALLNAVNARIEELKASGKLEGAKNVSALVENYIVSLYGEVPNPAMKYQLEREIVGIPGVRVVINHIGLNEDIPGNLGKTSNRIGP